MSADDRELAAGAPTQAAPANVQALAASDGLGPTLAAERSASADPVVRPGDVLGDRYRVVERIGAGGMGEVFLAEHTAIGKAVAIKVLGSEFAHREKLVERFMQEARAASLIRHEHIVDITDFGHARDGVPYYVMEYLEGESLAARIRREGRLPWPTARAIMLQICAALHAAHQKGVIHRDMKPDNCFIIERTDNSTFVKVLDFGIAKIITEGANKNLTQTGAVMGTAAYMSPEQAQSLELDARTDIYSAAVVLYQMLTGRVPFEGSGFLGILTKHLTERVPSMRKVAPDAGITTELDRVVLRALSKDRERRYSSAAAFAEAMKSLGVDGRAPGRKPTWLLAAGGMCVVGVLYLVTTTDAADPAPTSATAASVVEANATAPAHVHEPAVQAELAPPQPESNTLEDPAPAPAMAVESSPTELDRDPSEPRDAAQPGVLGEGARSAEDEEVTKEAGTPVEPAAASAKRPSSRSSRKSATRPKPPPEDPLPESLSGQQISRGIAQAQAKATSCKKHGALPGTRVKVTFTVGTDGKVTSANAHAPHKGLPLGRCVADLLRGATFPRAQSSTQDTREIEIR